MDRLTFLGTGGGRFAAILQARATGGIYLQLQGGGNEVVRLHIDPGPGALVRMLGKGLDPLKTNGILVSHCHPDHYADAEILVEGMTDGGNRHTGALVASRSVLEGVEGFGPAISRYHSSKPGIVKAASPGDCVLLSGIKVEATRAAHSDPSSVGFRIHARHGIIGYVCDTALEGGVAEAHGGSRILVLPVTRPLGMPIPHHLTVEDAAQIAGAVRPELALLNHFGMRVIRDRPERAAEWIRARTGVRTVAATDGMEWELGEELKLL